MASSKDSEEIRIIKPSRAKRRKRHGLSPKQVRQAIDLLRAGVEPQVTFSFDKIDMANQAVKYCQAAMFQAMEILEGKQ